MEKHDGYHFSTNLFFLNTIVCTNVSYDVISHFNKPHAKTYVISYLKSNVLSYSLPKIAYEILKLINLAPFNIFAKDLKSCFLNLFTGMFFLISLVLGNFLFKDILSVRPYREYMDWLAKIVYTYF